MYPTIHDLEGMTAQNIFDHVAIHLLRQRARSVCEDGRACAYRGEQGRACAVGALIPGAYDMPSMEGCDVTGVIALLLKRERTFRMALFLMAHRELLAELQTVHDGVPVEFWPKALCAVARMFALSSYVVLRSAAQPGQERPVPDSHSLVLHQPLMQQKHLFLGALICTAVIERFPAEVTVPQTLETCM